MTSTVRRVIEAAVLLSEDGKKLGNGTVPARLLRDLYDAVEALRNAPAVEAFDKSGSLPEVTPVYPAYEYVRLGIHPSGDLVELLNQWGRSGFHVVGVVPDYVLLERQVRG